MAKAEMGFDLIEGNGIHTLIIRQVQHPKLTDPCRARHFTIGNIELHTPEESFVISPDLPRPIIPFNFSHVVIIKLLDALPMPTNDGKFVQEKLQLFVAELNPTIAIAEQQIWIDARVVPVDVEGRIMTVQAHNISKPPIGNNIIAETILGSPLIAAQASIARMRATQTMEKMKKMFG